MNPAWLLTHESLLHETRSSDFHLRVSQTPFGEFRACRDPVMDVHGSGSRSEKQVPPGGGQLPVGGVSLFWVSRGYGVMYYGLESILFIGTFLSCKPGVARS